MNYPVFEIKNPVLLIVVFAKLKYVDTNLKKYNIYMRKNYEIDERHSEV